MKTTPHARAAVCTALVLCTSQTLVLPSQQVPGRDTSGRISATGTGRLAGVVAAEGEYPARPIRRAIVTLMGTSIATFAEVITDDEGRFAFVGLPAGRFTLTAHKAAYIKAYYGSARPGRPPGMPVALADGEQVTNLSLPLARGAAISGRVIDQSGAPVASAQVQVRLVSIVNGARQFGSPRAGLTMVTTDDRGAYRVYGLPAGEYVVRATGGGGFSGAGMVRVMTADDINAAVREVAGRSLLTPTAPPPPPPVPAFTRVPSYHPGVTDVSLAQSLVVAAGDDRENVDIVSVLARAVRVEGLAVGPVGQRLSNISVGIANLSSGSLFTSLGGVRASSDGRFAVSPLTPGRWLLFGRATEAGIPSDGIYPWWGQTEVVVGEQDLDGVVLQFLPGSTVSGQLVFRGQGPPPDPATLRVSLTPLPVISGTGGSVSPVMAKPDGSFMFEAVPPGKYRVAASAAGAWSLRSATADDRDTLDDPLEVVSGRDAALILTMSDQSTELSGTLLDQLGRPAPEYSVLVFSADRAMWTVSPRRTSGVVKLGSDGRYRITGLPPGDYLLCVITDIDPGQIDDMSLLEQLAQLSIPVTLAEGEKKEQDFRIGG